MKHNFRADRRSGLWLPNQKPCFGAKLIKGHPLARGLVGCWVMNEGGGDRIYNIANPNLHEGVFDNTWGAYPDWQGGGVNFPAGAQIIVPNHAQLSPSEFSIVMGFMPTTAWATYDSLFMKCSSTNWSDGYGVWFQTSVQKLWFFVDSYSFAADAPLPSINVEHQIVCTYDGTTAKIYLNGVKGNDVNRTLATNSADLLIGNGTGGSYDFNGVIYYKWFYDRDLSAEEVSWLHREPCCMIEYDIPARYYFFMPGLPVGEVSVDFSVKKPAINFLEKAPDISFEEKKPNITFSVE